MCNSKQINKLTELKRKSDEDKIVSFFMAKDIGKKFKKEDVEFINPNHFDEIDPNESFYYYDGPLDEKTRKFCRTVLELDKYYTQSDLDLLSSRLGYNVDLYMGTYNCRHEWKRARLKSAIKDGYVPPTPSNSQVGRVARSQGIIV